MDGASVIGQGWIQALMSWKSSDAGLGPRDGLAAIAAAPANASQRKIAFRAFIILLIITVANVPFADIQLGRNDYFVPFIHTAIFMANLLTAAFLFAQYSIYRQRALLFVAGGFVCSGLLALVHLFSFPSPGGSTALIGDRLNSPSWLFVFWQITLQLAVIVYALSKDKSEAADRHPRSVRLDIGVTVAAALMVTAALTCLASAVVVGYLPPLHEDVLRRTQFALELSVFVAVVNLTALAVLFVHRRTLLDQWLMVTLFAWLPALVLGSFFSSARFSAVWYLVWVYALFTGSSLLLVMLIETLLVYRRSDRHQKLLIAELDHRVKNVLAQVDGVISATDQGSRSTSDFIRSLRERIQSMASAHTLLSESRWRGVALDGLIRTEVAPYSTSSNVRISGPSVTLTPAEAQGLAKVLHEMVTNAAKYGSLSIPGGEVSVSWDRKPNGQTATLILEWRELGGPPVAAKIQSGYGTDLIRNLIPHELDGKVDLVFAQEGVNCRIEFKQA
jgi:two-component sensor histidine kinase